MLVNEIDFDDRGRTQQCNSPAQAGNFIVGQFASILYDGQQQLLDRTSHLANSDEAEDRPNAAQTVHLAMGERDGSSPASPPCCDMACSITLMRESRGGDEALSHDELVRDFVIAQISSLGSKTAAAGEAKAHWPMSTAENRSTEGSITRLTAP